jgi:hypothetical protein
VAITAAQIEANGWVLKLTLTASLSSVSVGGFSNAYGAAGGVAPDYPAQWATNFSAYALNPSGTPAVTLACTTAGFTQNGLNVAVSASASVARSLIATKVLRKPVDARASDGFRRSKEPDEADLGGGSITVRIALSQHVYAGDASLVLTTLAGWRTGESAQTIAVTNNSTIVAPKPIVRWSDAPYQLQSGTFSLECVVASHHPSGVIPVAGVKFTVTDGTTIKTYWATALSTSNAYSAGGSGKGLRVYSVSVDPTVATALTKGLLRCDFKVFPWIGPAQCSDTGDTAVTAVAASNTPSMTSLGTAARVTTAQVPFVVAYNPGGAWITPRYAYVDPSSVATASASNVSTNPVTAASTPLPTINIALESLRLDAAANTGTGTVVAANGQVAITQSLDGCRVRLKAGVSFTGTTAVTAGAQTSATHVIIEGDPADSSPIVNCIWRAGASVIGNSRITLVRATGLSIEAQSQTMMSTHTWVDNFELRAIAGSETSSSQPPFAGTGNVIWATNGKWWKHGNGLQYFSYQLPVLVRNVSVERTISAPATFNCARLPTSYVNAGNHGITVASSVLTDVGMCIERLIVGNDLRYLNLAQAFVSPLLRNSAAPANLTLGKPVAYLVASRGAWINNVCENYNGSAPLWASVGEFNSISSASELLGTANGGAGVVATENIIEGNTLTGDRVNSWYNIQARPTIAANDIEDSIVQVNRVANNVLFKNASKQDRYDHAPIKAQRIGVALSSTRSKAYLVGDEIVIAGSPAFVYHCTVAGTTPATGGPTGTGTGQVESSGGVTWDFFANETRQHGYRSQATGAWSSHYGVGYEGNIDLENLNDGPDPAPAVGNTYTGAGGGGSLEFIFEFYGINGQSLFVDGINLTTSPFTNDLSGGANRQPYQTGSTTGGGNYKPLTTGSGTYIIGRAKTASVDTDSYGITRLATFAAGALQASFGLPSGALAMMGFG